MKKKVFRLKRKETLAKIKEAAVKVTKKATEKSSSNKKKAEK